MKSNTEEKVDLKDKSKLNERIQRLKYSMVYDYRNKQCQENLLMFIMDV